MRREIYGGKEDSPEDLYREAQNMRKKSHIYEKGPTQVNVIKTYTAAARAFKEEGNLHMARKVLEEAKKFTKDPELLNKIKENLSNVESSRLVRLGRGLEKKFVFATISIIFLLSSLFFVSSGFTGYAILNLPENNSNWIGLCFFVCGLIFAFIYLKKNKDN